MEDRILELDGHRRIDVAAALSVFRTDESAVTRRRAFRRNRRRLAAALRIRRDKRSVHRDGFDVPNHARRYGGQTTATIPVTAGETLAVFVGGASDVREGGNVLSNRVVVAGGGGGGGAGGGGGNGGNGGGLVAANGGASSDSFANGGGGGTQSAGGLPGSAYYPGVPLASPGTLGLGGNGGAVPTIFGDYAFIGVGGGGGGGGGSSYAEPSATNVTMTQGTNNGNGWVTITW
jgi:hypothetical protein